MRVVNVGQCDADHGSISRLQEKLQFGATVDRAHGWRDALAAVALGASCPKFPT